MEHRSLVITAPFSSLTYHSNLQFKCANCCDIGYQMWPVVWCWCDQSGQDTPTGAPTIGTHRHMVRPVLATCTMTPPGWRHNQPVLKTHSGIPHAHSNTTHLPETCGSVSTVSNAVSQIWRWWYDEFHCSLFLSSSVLIIEFSFCFKIDWSLYTE